ncbi:MAG: EAL domain-containing protein [Burkholderiales bacterium]|nr:EAL domain-containing protein [Burkholderiales bacterium]
MESAQDDLLEARYRTLLEHAPEAILVFDAGVDRVVDANQNALRLFGMSREQLYRMHPVDLSAPIQSDGRQAGELAAGYITAALGGGAPVFEWVYRDAAGQDIGCEVHLVRLPHATRALVRASVIDIGERKRMLAALRDSEAKFATVFRNCPEAISITTEKDGRYIEVNEAFERMTGFTHEEVAGRSALDLGLWADGLERKVLMGRLEREGRVENYHAHLRRREGELRIRQLSAERVEVEGRPCLVVISRDVTQQRRLEDELRLAARVFESTDEGIVVTDPAERIIAVNPAFEQMTGYREDELRGQRPTMLAAKRHDPRFLSQLWEKVHHTGRWQGELWARSKSGEEVPYLMTMSAVRDDEGAVINHVGVMRDISHIKRSQEQLEYLANYDALTGLGNRNLFMSQLKVGLDRAARHHRRLALIFIDLDNFKTINDTLGHDVGDLLLAEVAHRLKASVRQEDVVCRLGGDEFTVYVEDFADPEALVSTAQRLVQSISEPYLLGQHRLEVTASVGISIYPNDGSSITELMKNADTAMYKVKEHGRNGFQFFREDMNARAFERMVFVSGLRRALEGGEFRLVYQPLLDLASGAPRGAECLLRWKHPDLGEVSPGSFVPVAEETGLILPIGEWVFRQLTEEMQRMGDVLGGRVSVNLSTRQLRDAKVVDGLLQALQSAGIDAARLSVDVPESALLDDSERTAESLRRLKSNGIAIAIDDFGTGYSSLSHLKRVPIDCVKIDRSLVRDIGADADDAAIVTAIITMSRSLGLEVVAEGVETREQAEFLRARGCTVAQGYYFSRPLTAEGMAEWLSAKMPTASRSTG